MCELLRMPMVNTMKNYFSDFFFSGMNFSLGSFTINGLTTWVTGAKNAELFIVAAKLQEKGLTALLVDSKQTSKQSIKVEKTATYSGKGLKASGIGSVVFENVSSPHKVVEKQKFTVTFLEKNFVKPNHTHSTVRKNEKFSLT